jgi:hypothetical protein
MSDSFYSAYVREREQARERLWEEQAERQRLRAPEPESLPFGNYQWQPLRGPHVGRYVVGFGLVLVGFTISWSVFWLALLVAIVIAACTVVQR